MKKISVVILIIGCLVIFATGCGKTEYPFKQATENIVKVEVIIMGEIHDPYTKHEYKLIKELSFDDNNKFIDDLKNIECKRKFGDPQTLTTGHQAFKINYSNGEYEIITYIAQGVHTNGKYLSNGYYGFDEEKFNDLVEKYSY